MWGWDRSKQSLDRDYDCGKYMYRLAASSYELEVEIHQAIQRPVTLKLEIVGADGEITRNVQSLYPRELFACALPEKNNFTAGERALNCSVPQVLRPHFGR